MYKIRTLFFLFLSVTILACNNDDDNQNPCEISAIASTEAYISAPNDELHINSANIEGDCLTINFDTSGCNGESWVVKFISSEIIDPSNPPSRLVRLSLLNTEDCEALITKELSFNINNLRVEGNSVSLEFEDFNIIYTY